jgi:hypothetical protein
MRLLTACALAMAMAFSGLAFDEDLPPVQLSIKGHRLVAEAARQHSLAVCPLHQSCRCGAPLQACQKYCGEVGIHGTSIIG